MNKLFYEDWYKKRVQKIINIFGKDWFAGKNILELGAAHGDIGIELGKLGAAVTFTDLRQEHLDSIKEKIKPFDHEFDYETKILNQENKYTFNKKFDLTLHLGVLYHLENWKQDLECALDSSNIIILDSLVSHAQLPDRKIAQNSTPQMAMYEGQNGLLSLFCQESVESHITKLGGKFIRFDNAELNSDVCWENKVLIQHLYDWDYSNNKLKTYKKNNRNLNVHHRRFWLVIK